MLMWWRRFARNHEPLLYVFPALAVILVVAIYPIFYSMRLAFIADVQNIYDPRPFVGFKNFGSILSDAKYGRALINTLIFMSISVTGSFVLGFGAALLLRTITWGKGFYRVVLIIPMMAAPLAVGLTWRWMLEPLFGLVNWMFGLVHLPSQTWVGMKATAMPVVLFVDIWQWYPLVFLLLYAGLSGLPREPFEAAEVDGAPSWMVFRYLTLPMLRPVILVALLLRVIDAFRTFDIIKVMTDGGPGMQTEVLSLYIWRVAFEFHSPSRAAAGSLIMLLVIGVISAILFKFLYPTLQAKESS